MDLFSLDSVILIIVTCNCLPFSYSRLIFQRHISWQVLKIAFRSLQIWKFSGRGYSQTPYKACAFGTHDNAPPLQKTKLWLWALKKRHGVSILFYILFKIRMFTLTQIQYHTKVLSIIYPAAKILSKSLQTSWMKIINSTTTKKKLQIENITRRKFQIVSQ